MSDPDRRFDIAAYGYAHRGLWDASRPENSIAAFEAAASAGVGCELDVRLTADGQLLVFHDATLARMCGQPERLDSLTWAEARQARLPDGSRIPTLNEALEAMRGEPVLIEAKIDASGVEDRGTRLTVLRVIETMRQTRSLAAMMSFDEDAVRLMASEATGRPVGQLIPPLENLEAADMPNLLLRARNAGCTFLAPHHTSLAIVRRASPESALACWTVRRPEELDLARRHGAAAIFEGFSPTLAKADRAPIQ